MGRPRGKGKRGRPPGPNRKSLGDTDGFGKAGSKDSGSDKLRAVGIDSALVLIAALGRRQLSTVERKSLDQFSEWAPIFDLETAVRTLKQQKENIAQK